MNDKKTSKEAEFETPQGLKPGSQLDARFPVSYQKSVPEAMRVMAEYFTALSRRDMDGLAKTLHFPYALYERTVPIIVESEDDLFLNPPPTINITGRWNFAGIMILQCQTFSIRNII